MNKLIIITIIILITIWNAFASDYKLTWSDKIIVNKLSSKIQILLDKQTLLFRDKLETKINDLQYQYRTNKKMYAIFEEIKKNTYLINHKNEYSKHYNQYNISYKKVQTYWLKLHNIARNDLWLILYSYDQRLDNTSYEWSKTQSEEKKIMSHKRDSWDTYYDYNKIEKWFNNRWVKCEVKWRTTSSESIAKYWYYCNDYDCTDELNKSLKEIFDIYMAEKWLWWLAEWHYRWITSENLTKIWLGLRIEEDFTDRYNNYRSYNYYVTTHYCTEFKK